MAHVPRKYELGVDMIAYRHYPGVKVHKDWIAQQEPNACASTQRLSTSVTIPK